MVAATALAVISGATHPQPLLFIAACSGFGALLRRWLGQYSFGNITQSFAAALLAGLAAGLAVQVHVNDHLRILAAIPCMILVPGPHIINGILDLLGLRLPLGLSRIFYAALTLAGICAGMLIGLKLTGIPLPLSAEDAPISLGMDVVCAAAAAACYGIFSMPIRMLVWPLCAGAAAHAVYWWVTSVFQASPAVSAGMASLIASFLLMPVSLRLGLPIAAIGFASVVPLCQVAWCSV